MDVLYFLKRRTAFVKNFYEQSTATFCETKRKIAENEEPYEAVWDGSDEPAYTSEWIIADESIQIIGYTCLSMLAASLHLYLKTWERLSGKAAIPKYSSIFIAEGWLAGYERFFVDEVGVPVFNECRVDLKLLTELILARNRIQHPESITSHLTTYSSSDLKKLSNVLFIDPQREVVSDIGPDGEEEWLVPPTVNVSNAKMYETITQVEIFAEWFEQVAVKALYGDDAWIQA